jgi:CubicO group peptidase (beta-lactamase class C family)
VISKAAGKPWPEFIHERIFAPLGMAATRTTTNEELIPHRAAGYVWADGKYQNSPYLPLVRPSGAFLSTARDMARWEAALSGELFFTTAERAMLWTPVKLNDGSTYDYAFGWEVHKVGTHRQVRHGGTMLGFRADISRYPDDGITVITLGNSARGGVEKISGGVAALYIEGLQPRRREAKMSVATLDSFTGRYQLKEGVLTVARLDNRLTLSVASGSRSAVMAVLTPEGATSFFDEDSPRTTYSFETDAQGKLFFVLRTEEGRESLRGPRI